MQAKVFNSYNYYIKSHIFSNNMNGASVVVYWINYGASHIKLINGQDVMTYQYTNNL